MTIISIEGNIGSGKSTLIKHLHERFSDNNHVMPIIFLKEPVEQWAEITDKNGVTMLEKFYDDKEKYSFPFQIMAYISRLSLLKEARDNNPDAIIISERSLHTDKHVFAQMLYDSDMIEEACMKIYLTWFDHFVKDFEIEKVIYVDATPEKCKSRVDIRHRQGEDKIALEYLQDCDKYHKQMLTKFNDNMVHIIDGNIDHDAEGVIVNSWINEIYEKVINPILTSNIV